MFAFDWLSFDDALDHPLSDLLCAPAFPQLAHSRAGLCLFIVYGYGVFNRGQPRPDQEFAVLREEGASDRGAGGKETIVPYWSVALFVGSPRNAANFLALAMPLESHG